MPKAPLKVTKDPVLAAKLKKGEMIVNGTRYMYDRSTRRVMAQSPDSEPYVPDPKDIPLEFGEMLESG